MVLPLCLLDCPPLLIFELGQHLASLIRHMHQLRSRCLAVGQLHHPLFLGLGLQLVLVLVLIQEENNEMAP